MTRSELREASKIAAHNIGMFGKFLIRLAFIAGLGWGVVFLFMASWAADGNPLDVPLASVNLSKLITVAVERLVLTFAAWGFSYGATEF